MAIHDPRALRCAMSLPQFAGSCEGGHRPSHMCAHTAAFARSRCRSRALRCHRPEATPRTALHPPRSTKHATRLIGNKHFGRCLEETLVVHLGLGSRSSTLEPTWPPGASRSALCLKWPTLPVSVTLLLRRVPRTRSHRTPRGKLRWDNRRAARCAAGTCVVCPALPQSARASRRPHHRSRLPVGTGWAPWQFVNFVMESRTAGPLIGHSRLSNDSPMKCGC